MKIVPYNQYLSEVTGALPKGAFLTVEVDDSLNTMTIGWANIGIIWGKPIFMVAVRKSRYTYQLIEKSAEFTVSIPFTEKMKKALNFCGTMSGRDYDKFKECNLTKVEGQEVEVPVIAGCDIHYECKILFKQEMNPLNLNKKVGTKFYANKDFHTFYFGEILTCYLEK